MSAATMPKSDFTVSSLLNSTTSTPTANHPAANAASTNANANLTANYLHFLNKFRPMTFPTPLTNHPRGLLAPPIAPGAATPTMSSSSSSSTSNATPTAEQLNRTQDDGIHDDPKAELESKDLWDQFHQHGTEMVGRRE